jgi:hypothetical protein
VKVKLPLDLPEKGTNEFTTFPPKNERNPYNRMPVRGYIDQY